MSPSFCLETLKMLKNTFWYQIKTKEDIWDFVIAVEIFINLTLLVLEILRGGALYDHPPPPPNGYTIQKNRR